MRILPDRLFRRYRARLAGWSHLFFGGNSNYTDFCRAFRQRSLHVSFTGRGENLLYTGDYRGGAEIPTKLQTLLKGQPLDVLISEGTNIQRGKLTDGKKGLDEDGICKKGLHHVLVYSIWQGYKTTTQKAEFLDTCHGMGLDVVDLHCSGHATPAELEAMIRHLEPKALIPVHCGAENRNEFLTMHHNCRMLTDGERWEIV